MMVTRGAILIKNGRVIDPSSKTDKVLDIYIEGGKFSKIGKNLKSRDAKVLDVKGKIVLPGLIDIHTHLREPGKENVETILSGSVAAVHGGFTSICCMPNTTPPIDNASTLDFILEKARDAHCNIYPIAAITKERKGETLSEMVELIREAKKRGVKVTCEVTPHHFTLTEEAVKSFDTNTKVNPPLRTKEDIKAIEKGLKDGTIDAIVSDHAPHLSTEKEFEYENAPFGMIGLQTTLSLVMKQLVEREILTLSEAVEKLTINPAKILNLKKGQIKIGHDADLAIMDPRKQWQFRQEDIKSLSINSPFIGWEFKGKAVCTIVGGRIEFSE